MIVRVFFLVRVFFSVMLFSCCMSCIQQKGKDKFIKTRPTDSIPEYLISQIEKFSIPVSKNMPDSNALFFYYSKAFDTSFLVHFQMENHQVYGKFYEVLPAYHRDLNDFADEKDQLLFFEGYSFTIDTTRWNKITIRANELLLQKKDTGQNYRSCFDCPSYYLVHNSMTAVNFGVDSNSFELFEQYLKDSLLNQYIRARKPVLHK